MRLMYRTTLRGLEKNGCSCGVSIPPHRGSAAIVARTTTRRPAISPRRLLFLCEVQNISVAALPLARRRNRFLASFISFRKNSVQLKGTEFYDLATAIACLR